MTARDDAAVAREFFERMSRGDVAGVLELAADDIEVDAAVLPGARVYRGRDGLAEFGRSFMGTWEGLRIVVEAVRHEGADIVVEAAEEGRARQSGLPMAWRAEHRLTVEDGRVVRWQPNILGDQRRS